MVLRAIKAFKLNVTQIHFDITNVELYGAYCIALAEGQTPPTPMPAYGRTKSGRKNVKQIQLGVNVTGDGGVPVGHVPLDGNTAEATTHLDNLRRLKHNLPKGNLLYIADTKLDTPENLLAIDAHSGQFLCGGVFAPHLQKLYLRHKKELKAVDYHPKSQDRLPPEKRDRYEAFEISDRLKGKVDEQRRELKYRMIFVWSEAKARQEAATRERHVAKIRTEFENVERNLNRYSLTTQQAVTRRLETAKSKYKEGELFEYELTKDRQGRLRLAWRISAAALKKWKYSHSAPPFEDSEGLRRYLQQLE